MIESPLIQELLNRRETEVGHRYIVRVLTARFGPLPEELSSRLRLLQDAEAIDALLDYAALCLDLASFQQRLQAAV